MFSRLQWLVLQLSRQMWVRATAFSLLGIVTALAAILLKRFIPDELTTQIGATAVGSLLNIIASSMLAVTIFSLSTMVAAFASSTNNVTPRATRLLSADSTAQNALATFVGSFLFSVVGIICLHTGLYGDSGRVILYAVTLGVLVIIVITLLRWIDYVLELGRVGPTSERVEKEATASIHARYKLPYLGGAPLHGDSDAADSPGMPVTAQKIGYVQYIDMGALQELAEDADLHVVVHLLPGDLAGPGRPVASVTGTHDEEIARKLAKAFNISAERSFDQDPRLGLCVMAEIASRALSPAVNDPGTAIEILSRGARVLAQWSAPYTDELDKDEEVRFSRIRVPGVKLDDLFDDFFVAIARDGATTVEVAIQLQKVLHMLASIDQPRYRQAALEQSRSALARCETALTLPDDLQRVRAAAERVAQAAGGVSAIA
ncbi:DUF2254 domain-containing protein [Lysobacter sp. A03]|uniref:DUF2254 domain-containing protein n=1 Tax=Lysobacter sp. A03 TaxID=1199154 RepID=UPI0005B6AC4A|nr:DUF2254 domain-containing protein [Lysobacter sp. A03]KIQ97318.1 hypothetical protein TI01_1144 [Lysobacter sp. A03]